MVSCCTALTKILSNLSGKSLDDIKFVQPFSYDIASVCDDPKFYKQKDVVFYGYKGIINGSKAATALGKYGKKARLCLIIGMICVII